MNAGGMVEGVPVGASDQAPSLGEGRYRVDITMNGEVVGNAPFPME